MQKSLLRWLALFSVALLPLGVAVFVATPDLLDCSTKFKEASEIDWEYAKRELTGTLNKYLSKAYGRYLGGSKRTLVASDIQIQEPIKTKENMAKPAVPFDYLYFNFTMPEREREMHGMINRCGLVEVIW